VRLGPITLAAALAASSSSIALAQPQMSAPPEDRFCAVSPAMLQVMVPGDLATEMDRIGQSFAQQGCKAGNTVEIDGFDNDYIHVARLCDLSKTVYQRGSGVVCVWIGSVRRVAHLPAPP
jgi:hypothetical protein